MKRILSICAVCCICFAVSAAETEIKKLFAEIRKLTVELKMTAITQYYSPDSVCISADGKKFDYQKMKKIAKASDAIIAPDATLTDVMVAASEMQGLDVTPEQIAQFKELENSKIGKALYFQLRDAANAQINRMKPKIKEVADSFDLISIKVSGNTAAVVYREKDLVTGKLKEVSCQMVKRNGKWLILREVSKFVK